MDKGHQPYFPPEGSVVRQLREQIKRAQEREDQKRLNEMNKEEAERLRLVLKSMGERPCA